MILGLTPYTFVHVAISLVAIATGFVVFFGLLRSRRMNTMTAAFLLFVAATNATGFGFPIVGRTPALMLGVISSVVLLVALLARYAYRLRGAWRPTYAIAAATLLYFNVFVLIVQLFQKVPALQGDDLPFAIAQGATALLFVVSGVTAAMRFHPPDA